MRDDENRWGFWRRVSLLLGVLAFVVVGLAIGPGLITLVTDRFSERTLPPYNGVADLRGESWYRLFDHDGDGAVDCFLRMPSTRWTRKGYRAGPETRRCSGDGVQIMPEDLRQALDELLRLRRELEFPHGRVEDRDDDGHADCLVADGTWRFAPEASCPDRRSDARALTESERQAADRVLVIEQEIRSRWLGGA